MSKREPSAAAADSDNEAPETIRMAEFTNNAKVNRARANSMMEYLRQ